MLKPSAHYPMSSVDSTKKELCKMSKMVVKVRLSTWERSSNAWTDEFATKWNYLGDSKANVEDLRQAVAGHMVLGKVNTLRRKYPLEKVWNAESWSRIRKENSCFPKP